MKEIRYISFWPGAKKLQTAAATVGKWDIWNNTKFKKKVENGVMDPSAVAEHNHQKALAYQFTAFDHDEVYATVDIKGGHIKVNFLDHTKRLYLAYFFSPSEVYQDKIFLDEAWYYHFTSESATEEAYRIHYGFDEQGQIAYRKYDELDQKVQDFEGDRKFDISGLYEAYPEFGCYESLISLERGLPLHYHLQNPIVPPIALFDHLKPKTE